MSTTKLSLFAALTFSFWATAGAETPPAWKAHDFVMEEVVVRAEAPPSFYMEEIVVAAQAPSNPYMEEVVVTAKASWNPDLGEIIVTAERPQAEVTPGTIRPPAFSEEPDSGRAVMEAIVTVETDEVRSYAAKDGALRGRRLF